MITLDQDVENETLHSNEEHCGIIILQQKEQGKLAISSLFLRFVKTYKLDKIKGKKILITPSFIRLL